MEKSTEKTLAALLAQAGLEPGEGDLERFGKLIDGYMANLRALQDLELGDEEIAPAFHPEGHKK